MYIKGLERLVETLTRTLENEHFLGILKGLDELLNNPDVPFIIGKLGGILMQIDAGDDDWRLSHLIDAKLNDLNWHNTLREAIKPRETVAQPETVVPPERLTNASNELKEILRNKPRIYDARKKCERLNLICELDELLKIGSIKIFKDDQNRKRYMFGG